MADSKNKFISVIVITIIAVLISIPLLKKGFYTIHDDQQIARLFLYDKALISGQIPPRWVDDLGFGFGYPLFNFYPPFVYALGEVFHLAGFDFINSVKIVFFLSVLLSGLAMFALTKQLFGGMAAIVSAIFYMCAPYRAVDMYVRGALAESFSFVWLPLILWSFINIYKNPRLTEALVASLFIALLMVTHNLIFLPFVLIMPIFLFTLFVLSNKKNKFLVFTSAALITGALLSAFFWLPSLTEKDHTIVNELLIVNLASYKIHFVDPVQLWNWTWGFGGSAEGLMDGISFKIGKLHIIISTLAIAFSVYLKSKITTKNFRIILIISFFVLFTISALMTTKYSEIVWYVVKPLAYLQFPWRFLTFTTLFSSILAGGVIYLLKLPVLKLPVAVILISMLISTNLKLFRPQFHREDLTVKDATSYEHISWDVSLSSFEYIPKGVELTKNEKGANMLKITKHELPTQKVQILSGEANIKILEKKPHRLLFDVRTSNESELKVNVFDFPGWHLYVNEAEQEINSDNKFRLITFKLQEGDYRILLEYKNTFPKTVANIISTISFLAILVYFIKRKIGIFRLNLWRIHIHK